MSNKTNGTDLDFSWQASFHTTLVTIACVIVLFNTPVIILFLKVKTLRYSPGNNFLVGLAVADILCAIFMIPTALLCEVDVFGETHRIRFCYLYRIASYVISVVSVYHIVAATLAKYCAVMFPLRNITTFTTARLKYTIGFIWFIAFLVGHIPVYWPLLTEPQVFKMAKIHSIFLLVFTVVIPTVILIATHVHIFSNLYVKRQARLSDGNAAMLRRNRAERNRKFVIVFLILFAVFLITWLPWYLIGAGFMDSNNDYLLVLRFVAPILNPLVFTFMKHDFRCAMFSVFRRGRKKPSLSGRSATKENSTAGVSTTFI